VAGSGKYYILGRKEKTKMGRDFQIALEYYVEGTTRNTFLCEVDDLYYSVLRDYDDLYHIDKHYSYKENSVEVEKMTERYGCYSWGIKEIAEHIGSVKKKLESDTELKDFEKEELDEVVSDLQRLHDIAMEKCKENNISPENLYINWWIDY
jgi:hypothetical protein